MEGRARADRFRRATWIAISTLVVFDLVCAAAVVFVPGVDPLARVIAIIGLMAVSVGLLMPLAQMWLARESEAPTNGRATVPVPIVVVNGVAGPVRVRVAEGSVDVEVAAPETGTPGRLLPRARQPSSFAGELVADPERSPLRRGAGREQDHGAAAASAGADADVRPAAHEHSGEDDRGVARDA